MAVPIIKMATIGILPSPLKVLYYKMKGAKIGKGVSIGLFSIITSKEIEIGDDSKIGPLTFINVDSLKMGKRCRINMMVAIDTGKFSIDNDSTIMEQVVVGGMLTPRSELTIGKRVKVFPYSFLNPTEKITIEDDAGIGGANYIFTHGSWQSVLDGFPVGFGPVTIKKGVWFPWRVFVMPNVTVGEYATIGAGSIITKDIPGYSLAAGSPAKVLRTGEEYIKKHTDEQKFDIVKNILVEFTEFMNYKYKEKKFVFAENSSDVVVTENNTNTKIVFSNTINSDINASAIIALKTISAEVKNKLIADNKIWFDIEGKESFYKKDTLWNDIKDFFSRYGVRFEILS